jgi:hypothetical protein
MSENISMTRIVDLPDQQFAQNGLGTDMYIPINGHPNPYGIPPPPAGGIAPPQQTQTGPTQYANTMYSSNVQGQGHNPPMQTPEQFNEMFAQQQYRLPQRDIPMNVSEHVQDEQIQPNYIPAPKITTDYIQEYQESADRKVREYEEKKMREKTAATWLDEFQTPILIGLLYFIFQLPIINTLIFKRFAFLSIYREDGNFNVLGLTLKCLLFGVLFYTVNKSIEMISNL